VGIYIPVNYDPADTRFVRCFGMESNAALAHWGPGRRDFCILHYVLQGCGFYNGNRVESGQGFYIHANQYQEYHSSTDQPWRYIWVMFSESVVGAEPTTLLGTNENHIFSYDFAGRLNAWFHRIADTPKPLSHHEALGQLHLLFAMHERKPPAGSVPVMHIRNAKAYIDNHCTGKITVHEAAEAIHINERYLYNLFVQHEQITPKAYIDARKREMAASLLQDTDMPIHAVAAAVGFENASTFTKFFIRGMGMTPSAYREGK